MPITLVAPFTYVGGFVAGTNTTTIVRANADLYDVYVGDNVVNNTRASASRTVTAKVIGATNSTLTISSAITGQTTTDSITFTPTTRIQLKGNFDSGTATSGGATTLTDTAKTYTVNANAGRALVITGGTGAGQARKISSNTATVNTVSTAWVTNPDATSTYAIANTIADIQAANDAGSWALMTTQGSQIRIQSRIILGDDTAGNRAYLSGYNQQIEFSGATAACPPAFNGDFWASTWLSVRDYSGVIFGEVLDYTDKTSRDGCSFSDLSTRNITVNIGQFGQMGAVPANQALFQLASCKNSAAGQRSLNLSPNPTSGSYIWNAEFTNGAECSPYAVDIYNITLQSGVFAFARVTAGFDRVIAANIAGPAAYTHPTGEAASIFKNLKVRNCSYLFGILTSSSIDIDYVNIDTDTWAIKYDPTYTPTAKLWIKYEVDITVKNTAGAVLSGIPVYVADLSGAVVVNPATITTDANGKIAQQTLKHGYFARAYNQTEQLQTPHTLRLRRYNYNFYEVSFTVAKKSDSTYLLAANSSITQTTEATVAAYTGIAITAGATKTVVLSAAHTGAELYDYTQYWAAVPANQASAEILSTTDGVNLTLATGWKLTVQNYLTFGARRIGGGSLLFTTVGTYGPKVSTTTFSFNAASGTYDLRTADISGTVTLVNTGGGAITVQLPVGVTVVNTGPNITVDQTASVNITISGYVTGSRIQLYDTNAATEIYNGIPGASPFAQAVAYTADKPIRIRCAYVNGVTSKEFIEVTQTLTATGLTYGLTQVAEEVYDLNAIDGSTVTGITIVDATQLINVTSATITWAEIYAYNEYWLFTAAGIIDAGDFIVATDAANYILTGFKIKNTSSPSVPLVITGGYGKDSVTGLSKDIIDTTGGNIYMAPDHAMVVTVGSGPLTAGQAADLATAAGYGSTLTTLVGYTDSIESRLPAALVSGKMDAVATVSGVPTAVEIRTEMDTNSTRLAAIDLATDTLVASVAALPSAAENATAVVDRVYP